MVRPVVADVALSFVSDINIPQVTLASVADSNQVEEYESDSEGSDIDMDGDSEELIISKPQGPEDKSRCGHGLMSRRKKEAEVRYVIKVDKM